MDLKEAAILLGLTPNAVRHRAKNGQSPFDNKDKAYEQDNKQKWWVFLDPDKLPPSNATSNLTSNLTSKSASKRPSNESKFSGEIKALHGHVNTLTEALSHERCEVQRLRVVEVQAIELKVENASLKAENEGLKKEAEALRKAPDPLPSAVMQPRTTAMLTQSNPPEAPKTAPQSGKGFLRGLLALFR